jgi:hypothetical protein
MNINSLGDTLSYSIFSVGIVSAVLILAGCVVILIERYRK